MTLDPKDERIQRVLSVRFTAAGRLKPNMTDVFPNHAAVGLRRGQELLERAVRGGPSDVTNFCDERVFLEGLKGVLSGQEKPLKMLADLCSIINDIRPKYDAVADAGLLHRTERRLWNLKQGHFESKDIAGDIAKCEETIKQIKERARANAAKISG